MLSRDNKISQWVRQLEEKTENIDRLEKEVRKHETTIADEKKKFKALLTEKENLEDAFRSLESKWSQLDRDLKKETDTRKEAENELLKLRSDFDDLTRKFSSLLFIS